MVAWRIAGHLERRGQRVDCLAKRPERFGAIRGRQQRHACLGGDGLAGRTVRARPDRPRRNGWRRRPPAPRRRAIRDSERQPGGARGVRASPACHRRPRGRAPGRTRAVRGSVRAGRSRPSGSRVGRAGRGAARVPPASRPRSRPVPSTLNVWPRTAASWRIDRSAGASRSSRAATRAWSVGGTSRAPMSAAPSGLPTATSRAAVLGQAAAREQHPDRLDRVQREAVGALDDPRGDRLRQSRDHPVEQLAHRRVRQRVEAHRDRATAVRAPAGPPLEELGAGQGQDEDRARPAPVEQVFEEVEQAVIGPLEVLDDEGDRAGLGESLEEGPPRGEQLGPAAGRRLADPEQDEDARLDPGALGLVGDVLLEHRARRRRGSRPRRRPRPGRPAVGSSRRAPRT